MAIFNCRSNKKQHNILVHSALLISISKALSIHLSASVYRDCADAFIHWTRHRFAIPRQTAPAEATITVPEAEIEMGVASVS